VSFPIASESRVFARAVGTLLAVIGYDPEAWRLGPTEAIVAVTVVRRDVEADGVITLIVAHDCLLLGRLGVATFKATGTIDSTDGVRFKKHGIGAAVKEVSTIMEVPSDVFKKGTSFPRIGVVSLPHNVLLPRIGVLSLLLPRIGVVSLE